jgi:hypothetical protein
VKPEPVDDRRSITANIEAIGGVPVSEPQTIVVIEPIRLPSGDDLWGRENTSQEIANKVDQVRQEAVRRVVCILVRGARPGTTPIFPRGGYRSRGDCSYAQSL